MTEKPVLFSGSMVRAILEGRKTQTRRVYKGVPDLASAAQNVTVYVGSDGLVSWEFEMPRKNGISQPCSVIWHKCPYGKVGARLWVRETWKADGKPNDNGHYDFTYLADGARSEFDSSEVEMGRVKPLKTCPSIFMPRWASRITLEITGIRVERVQDISEDDAIAEGISPNWAGELSGFIPVEHGYLPHDADSDGNAPGVDVYEVMTAKQCFERLWDSINGKKPGHTWADNSFVWIVGFKAVTA